MDLWAGSPDRSSNLYCVEKEPNDLLSVYTLSTTLGCQMKVLIGV